MEINWISKVGVGFNTYIWQYFSSIAKVLRKHSCSVYAGYVIFLKYLISEQNGIDIKLVVNRHS